MRIIQVVVVFMVVAALTTVVMDHSTAHPGATDARDACVDVRAAAQLLPMHGIDRPGPARARLLLQAASMDARRAADESGRWRRLYREVQLARADLRRHSDIAGSLGGACFSVLRLS